MPPGNLPSTSINGCCENPPGPAGGTRISGLSAREFWKLQESDLLIERTCELAEVVWAMGGQFVIENPIDWSDPELAGRFVQPDHYSLWQHPRSGGRPAVGTR